MPLFWLILGSYLFGSIPCGYLLGKIKRVDLRRHGSGNTGATNAFRVLGKQLGMLVFFCDVVKGLVPALAGAHFGPGWGVLAGLATVAGHNWSVFLGFRGGRGVATGAGVVLALMPKAAIIAFIIWLLVLLSTGYVSLASIIATMSVPVIALFLQAPWIYFAFAIPAPLFIVVRHLPNIRRLRNGTEPRIYIW